MFENISEKLNATFKKLSGRGRLTEQHLDEGLKEVRRALLEADVHFSVVRDFLENVRSRSLNTEVLQSLSPTQQIIKIVDEELTQILGGDTKALAVASTQANHTNVIMIIGLQGAGKTTTAAKLALHLKKQNLQTMLAAVDLQRPAAIEQLVTLGNEIQIPVYKEGVKSTPLITAKNALNHARDNDVDCLIIDTAGRLTIDEALMDELLEIQKEANPIEILLVIDAMTGQDSLRTAEEFNAIVPVTGLILSKMDGDARGGAALSITSITNIPIKFMGVGEKLDGLEQYHPERLASRILGMGDVLTLIEKAEETIDENKAAELQKKMQRAEFNLEDFLEQMQQMKKMGPLSQIVDMVPGLSNLSKQMPQEAFDENQLNKTEAIIQGMTPTERQKPDIIGGSRRKRIANGSGVSPSDVNALINQFKKSQKLMKQLASGKRVDPKTLFR
ncbi:MAG: signal recognition particle protein [SAR202 cluster bacterium]|nr:signal recognition particle protein [SAR202 cluster bacterium]|tara:strand:+ start:4144 stop:5481 length:1338 start_codon:yes stop_codon:yes gene_type:complete